MCPDIPNLVTLVLQGGTPSKLEDGDPSENSDDIKNDSDKIADNDISNIINLLDNEPSNIDNSSKLVNERFKGNFVSKNVVNLSSRQSSKAEISLLTKGLKFVPTPSYVNRSVLKEELEINHVNHVWDKSRKSRFNSKGKDAAIEIYLSRLEEEILAIETQMYLILI